ncbi:FG-GAP-like repeat-containing protein [Flavivirga algicola]|uniref:T9SS type A sorting domain-containing protein n=1 Tax=Flavivirga algicola TaxID=2729136 RepID=A0ABX1RW38_9FLAO|nr:FG-GAP-like repeat-containing protein [Flavivirga algicola]NMH86575.1 T9SS type A sorting domain-containing protein [Flavivirga algicola]
MKRLIPIFYFLLLLSNTTSFSQTFKRFEQIANLDVLKENNGVAVADYDGDYDLDLFVVAKAQDEEGVESSQSKLFRNNNDGTFTDVTLGSGLLNLFPNTTGIRDNGYLDGFKYGVAWGDYDNDGYPDIFFTHALKIQLFHNNGDGTFTETTTEAGIERQNNCNNAGATWFDANKDGFLDIFISVWTGECGNLLYINNADGTFTNRSEFYGVNTTLFSYMSMPFDFNNDTWMDLYVSNDFFGPNELLINKSGNIFEEEGTAYNMDRTANYMGISINDYNNDGNFDIYVTDINENLLFSNNGNNTFSELAEDKGVLSTGWSWDCPFADFDLDGDEDLFVVNGFKSSFPNGEPNVYFENDATNGYIFREQTGNAGLGAVTMSVGATPFDYDNDGDLDLFVTSNDQESFFYQNTTITTNSVQNPHWFKVMLEGTVSNRNAIGTRVFITTDKGSLSRYFSGVGFLSQSIQPLHFGLANATTISEIKIEWPSGLVDTYNNLPIDTVILAKENDGYQIVDLPQAIKAKGCIDPTSCNYNPEAVEDDGSCEYLSPKTIQGANTSSFLSTESYSYGSVPSQNNSYEWHVSGGEIVEGHNTNTIIVKWGVEESGLVSVIETDTSCSSEQIKLEIELTASDLSEKYSVARLWNEALLNAIRGDYARPTVHARNLFHASIALYDSWAIYDDEAQTYLLGKTVHGFDSELMNFEPSEDKITARAKTISYAVYRLLSHRFKSSPSVLESQELFDHLMNDFGYDISFESTDYSNGNAAALGNYIAQTIIDYGYADGAREQFGYNNSFYLPVNQPLFPKNSGNSNLNDPNRWQPLSLREFIDQSGNLIPEASPDFLSPEWGYVAPFSLKEEDKAIYNRDGDAYTVYHDPLSPPYLNLNNSDVLSEAYKWGFSMVSIWGAHLDPSDGILWDISPKSIGNVKISNFPKNFDDFSKFYRLIEGGDIGTGHDLNPYTNAPYQEQMVPRGDYARVLAEFWADGPDSETPPGHWFTLLNYVSDHELLQKRLAGSGDILNALEWDVKSYFLLGGAMHDAAISAWSIKGWYDYIRPISAIRYMAELGQSSNNMLNNYHVAGIPLQEGYVEVVEAGDPLEGRQGEHIGKIKLYTWRGHDYIGDIDTDHAGVGWILAENWWPYQRPSFVTPPFAGYVSGHSTYSRAAAEVMTLLTGDAFFPGGYGEFIARKNEFLVFEEGPSVDVKLQWATYRDASDQCSLSRIWGGIHPPADDIPGRLIGEKIGIAAYNFGVEYFSGKNSTGENNLKHIVYPNPFQSDEALSVSNTLESDTFELVDIKGSIVKIPNKNYNPDSKITTITLPQSLAAGLYILKTGNTYKLILKY